MGLKDGLYIMAFPQFINDEDPVNNYDDDGTYIRYSSGLGAAIYVGDVPDQFFFTFFQDFRDKLCETYGTEKPARLDYYKHDSNEPAPSGSDPYPRPTEEELMHMLRNYEKNYKDVSPGQREVLKFVLDVKNDIMQFIGESDKQSPPMTDIADFLRQIQTAIGTGGLTKKDIADATFDGVFRANARFKEPIDEAPIEKVHRLRCDDVEWKFIGRIIYEEEHGEHIDEKNLPAYVDALRKQHKREYPEFYETQK